MQKVKENALGFTIIAAIWLLLSSVILVMNIVDMGFDAVPILSLVISGCYGVVVFVFYMTSREKENGLAIVGLIFGIISIIPSFMSGAFEGNAIITIQGLSLLLLSFGILEHKFIQAKILGWTMIGYSILSWVFSISDLTGFVGRGDYSSEFGVFTIVRMFLYVILACATLFFLIKEIELPKTQPTQQ